jgi:hypothetical protein
MILSFLFFFHDSSLLLAGFDATAQSRGPCLCTLGILPSLLQLVVAGHGAQNSMECRSVRVDVHPAVRVAVLARAILSLLILVGPTTVVERSASCVTCL